MLFFKDRKKEVREFVDMFMKQYLHLRSKGNACEEAIMEIYSKYHEEGSKDWNDLSLMDQILMWHGLSSSEQMKKIKQSRVEEDRIVKGVAGTLPIACKLKSQDIAESISWAEKYLKEKYNIGKKA